MSKITKHHNKKLVESVSKAGVKTNLDFAVFQNHGYQGLYGGLGTKEIHQKKNLENRQKFFIAFWKEVAI